MKTILLFALLAFGAMGAQAQFRIGVAAHFDITNFDVTGPIDQNGNGNVTYTPLFVVEERQYKIWHLGVTVMPEYNTPLGDEIGIAVLAGVKLNLNQSPNNDFFNNTLSFDFPVYGMFRYGATGGRNTDKPWGLGIGAGYHYHRQPIPYGTISVVAELVLPKNKSIRFHFDPVPFNMNAYYTSEGIKEVGSMQQLGIALVWWMDFDR